MSRQSKGYQRIALGFLGDFGVATGSDHEELFALGGCLVGHGRGGTRGGQF